MANQLTSIVLFPGEAEGTVLRLSAPVSFWGGVSPKTGTLIQPNHPDYGACISGKILILPGMIGSSSSSAVLLELLYKNTAPSAILMTEVDAILALGNLVAEEMGYQTIPMLRINAPALESGQFVKISIDGTLEF